MSTIPNFEITMKALMLARSSLEERLPEVMGQYIAGTISFAEYLTYIIRYENYMETIRAERRYQLVNNK